MKELDHGQVKYVTDRFSPKISHFEIKKYKTKYFLQIKLKKTCPSAPNLSVSLFIHYLPYILTLYRIHFIERSVIYRIKMKKYRYINHGQVHGQVINLKLNLSVINLIDFL
jgi:hypothetical protein